MDDHRTLNSTCWLARTLMARGTRHVAEDRQHRCPIVALSGPARHVRFWALNGLCDRRMPVRPL